MVGVLEGSAGAMASSHTLSTYAEIRAPSAFSEGRFTLLVWVLGRSRRRDVDQQMIMSLGAGCEAQHGIT